MKSNLRNKIVTILIIGIIISIIIPVVIACFYTVPVGDDLNFITVSYLTRPKDMPFLLYNTIDLYRGWQGTFVSNAYLTAVSIFHIYGLTGLHLQLAVLVGLFFLSSFLACYFATGYFFERSASAGLLLQIICISYPLFVCDMSEVFYWATGSTYLLGIAILFFSIFCYFLYVTSRKGFIIALIVAFLGGGQALDISALICSLLVFFVFCRVIRYKRWDNSIIIAVSAIIGTLVNVAAPGYYVRHGFDGTGGFLSESWTVMKLTVQRVLNVILEGYAGGTLFLIALISFCMGLYLFRKPDIKIRYLFVIPIYGLLAIIVSDFPVVLGYMNASINTRNEFIEDLAIGIYTVISFVCIGGFIGQKVGEKWLFRIKQLVILGAVVGILLLQTKGVGFLGWNPYKMMIHEAKGDFAYIYDAETELLQAVRDSEEDNAVVLSRNFKGYKWCNVATNKLQKGPDYWRNSEVAEYYGKSSLSRIMDLNEWIRIFYQYHGIEPDDEKILAVSEGIRNHDESVYQELYCMFDGDKYRNDKDYAFRAYSVFLNRSDAQIKSDIESVNAWAGYIASGEDNRYDFIKQLLESDEFRKGLFVLN